MRNVFAGLKNAVEKTHFWGVYSYANLFAIPLALLASLLAIYRTAIKSIKNTYLADVIAGVAK